MATVTSFRNDDLPQADIGVRHVKKTISVVNGSANNGDQINVFGFAPDFKGRLIYAVLRTSATLGASATVQLRLNRSGVYTVLTAATTAGAASKATDVAQAGVPMDVQGGDILELLVGGANITAAADITVDVDVAGRAGEPS